MYLIAVLVFCADGQSIQTVQSRTAILITCLLKKETNRNVCGGNLTLKWHVEWKFFLRLALAMNQIIRNLALFVSACRIMMRSWLGPFGEPQTAKCSLGESGGSAAFQGLTSSPSSGRSTEWEWLRPREDGDGATPTPWRWEWSHSQGVEHHGDGVTPMVLNTLTTRTE